MLLLDKHQRVTACALYLEHDYNEVTFDRLRARHCPLTNEPQWSATVERAIESELDRARNEQLHYVELGGWAVSEDSRGTAGPLALALAVYGFSRRAGGALGITTATFRHCSATILKRLGGARFEVDGVTLPPYYDSRYECMRTRPRTFLGSLLNAFSARVLASGYCPAANKPLPARSCASTFSGM